jgi:Secretion system C-terminal sorting domain
MVINKMFYHFLLIISIFLLVVDIIYSQKFGSTAYIEVNEIYLPFDNKGVIADVNTPPTGSGGRFAGNVFLFSSGFWLSGYSNDSLWANAVTSASLVEDYQPGTVGMNPSDPKASIYRLSTNDVPFGQSWQDWIDAVELGADFYDGDGDGIYNPVDHNSNGEWDPDEDKPDIFLDETYWCVFNDGIPSDQRRWHSEPQGIEIRQTIFAAASTDATGNVVFVRYRIKNTGLVADTLKDVYFSVWADADVGDYSDDVYGSDTLRQGVYFYNNTTDALYGNQVPSFMMDFLTGPLSYIPGVTFIDINGNNRYEDGIDTPLDTAVSYRGPLDIRIHPGAKNQPLTSSVFQISGDPALRDPFNISEVRNNIYGLTSSGITVDPCTWPYSEVRGGVPCNEVNPYIWCSGDPVSNIGWIANFHADVRGPASTGPFTLIKDEEVEILVGYEIDRGSTPLGGITAVRNISDFVQDFYENNFGYPIVSVEDEELPQILSFNLEQNYPNPFNPSTKIKFTIPFDGTYRTTSVQLIVYDVLGNEIATLVNEEKATGNYEVEFIASGLPSGIYIYKLTSGALIQSKKMILLK